jgi:hypothetical protein
MPPAQLSSSLFSTYLDQVAINTHTHTHTHKYNRLNRISKTIMFHPPALLSMYLDQVARGTAASYGVSGLILALNVATVVLFSYHLVEAVYHALLQEVGGWLIS